MPPIAHSMGKVMRFSTSRGESASTGVLIWTWTFVMSGTASIGRRPKLYRPRPAIPRVTSSTIHRWRIENERMRSMAASVRVAGFGLLKLGLQNEAAADHVALAGCEPRKDLVPLFVGGADRHRAREKAMVVLDEDT